MSLSYAALERLSQKKFFSKPAPQPATISTINIGVEDFLSPHSSEDAGHYSSSQRPPRRTGGSVHFNMPAASKVSPRHTVQNNKTIPASKAGNGNGPARDSSAVLSSIASRGKKSGMGGALLKPLQRDITASEAQSRQATPIRGKKQRPSTAEASGEKPSEGMGNVFQRHSSCELRDHAEEDLQSPLSQKISFSRSSPDPLQIPSRQEINNEFGMSMRDMSESLSKIEELIFPSKAGQEVVMRENMAFEASPILSSGFLELEDGSMKPLYVSPFARSQSRNSDGDLERAEDAIVNGVRKQRRAQSAVKWRRRNDRSMPCHEKSPSCDNETTFREKVNRRWTLVRSSAEFLSSSLPLYGDRSDSGSGASTEEEGDVSSTRRRWPKIPQCFSYSTIRGNSASKSESSFFGTESPTTQVETEPDAVAEHSDTSGRRICRSMIEMGKSRRSRLEDSNLACDRTTTGHESVANAESGEENNLKHHDVLNEKQNEGFEEENEVLCKDGYTGIDGGNGGCMAHEPAKKRDGSSSEHSTPRKDTMVIVLPTSSVSNGQSTKQTITQAEQRATQQHSESMQVLFPTKEAQEQRKDQLSNSVRISADASQQEMNHHEEDQDGAEVRSLSDVDVSRSSPHTKNQIHCQSSEEVLTHKHLSFYFEDSSTISESADEKHVDVDSSGAQHQDDLELEQPVSRDVFDVRCEKNRSSSGFFNVCAQKSTDAQDKAPIATIQQSNTEEKYIHASLSTEKLCSILSYLGQVEQSNLQENLGIPTEKGTPLGACFYSLSGNGSPRAVLEHAEDAVSLTSSSQTAHSGTFHLSGDVGGDSRVADCNPPAIAATTVFDGVRKKVQELKQKIAEQEAKIAQLQAENKKLVREREEHMLLAREKYHKQLEHQAAEYKVIIQHHLSVNEKMLRDKEQLSEKCCNLAGILSVAESKFDEKVKQLSEQWSREMKKAKELWAVGEKQRMKIWQEKKIKDLKETAIRGLEPHIDNLNDKHRLELAKMETRHAENLQSTLDAQNLDCRRQICELRDHLQQERDKMMDNERLAAHARMAEVAERFEQQAIQQRMRVATEITAQLERSEAGRREDKKYSQELLARLQKEASKREETLRKQMEKSVEEMAMKKDRQIQHLQSQMFATAQQFQQKINDRVTEGMRNREKELRAELTKERDEQIELVIERLQSEKEELVAQSKKEMATKVNEMVAEKLGVELELKEYKCKFSDLGNAVRLRITEKDLELEEAGKKVTASRKEIQNQARMIEELRSKASQHDAKLRNQEEAFETRLKEEQIRLQQMEMDLNESNSKASEMRNRKIEELAEVEARVKQTIVKKDVVISNLREQLFSANQQIKTTEYLLQQEHNRFISES